jgi:hypothetical protein
MLAQYHTGRDQGHLFLIRPGDSRPAVATYSPQAVLWPQAGAAGRQAGARRRAGGSPICDRQSLSA